MEMSPSNVGNSSVDNTKWFKFAVCLGLLLGVLTTIMVAVILALVIKGDSDNIMDSPAVEGCSSLNDEERISSMYKGFFRSPEEQNEYKIKLENATKLSVNVCSTYNPEVGYFTDVSTCSPGLKCSVSRTWNWTAVTFNSVYHGCCESHNFYQVPKYLTDIYGNIQLIAQFDKKKQYVTGESCTQIPGCQTCLCTQLQHYVSLVYDQGNNTGDYATGLFPLPGCCKCLNI